MRQLGTKQDLEIVELNNISEPWKHHVELMLHEFDKELRIEWLPKFMSDFVIKFRRKNKIKEIKTSFGELKVVGNFTPEFEKIIRNTKRACRDTCEFCGKSDTEKVTIKSWVYNCCKSCIENKK